MALPAVVATGILLVRRHPVAPLLGGVLLVKVTMLFAALWLGVAAQLLDGREVVFRPTWSPAPSFPS